MAKAKNKFQKKAETRDADRAELEKLKRLGLCYSTGLLLGDLEEECKAQVGRGGKAAKTAGEALDWIRLAKEGDMAAGMMAYRRFVDALRSEGSREIERFHSRPLIDDDRVYAWHSEKLIGNFFTPQQRKILEATRNTSKTSVTVFVRKVWGKPASRVQRSTIDKALSKINEKIQSRRISNINGKIVVGPR